MNWFQLINDEGLKDGEELDEEEAKSLQSMTKEYEML
jgi:hypothetical protein